MASVSEQITALESTRAAKAARMGDIQAKASEEGRTKDESEREEFATLRDEIKTIDEELVDLHEIEKMQAHRALAVVDGQRSAPRANGGAQLNGHGNGVSQTDEFARQRIPAQPIRTAPALGPGIGFSQLVKAVAANRGNLMQAAEFARHQHGDQSEVAQGLKALSRVGWHAAIDMMQKAAVSAAVTTDADWAGPLVYVQRYAGDFVDFLRPQTILGRIPGMRQVPFNVNIATQATGASAGWVGEGAAKPLTAWTYGSVNFRFAKIAAIVVQTEELARFSSPSSDALFRDELVAAIAERQDLDFLDPTNAGTTNVKPASVTNGVSAVTSSGNTADHVRADLVALLNRFTTNNLTAANPVLIMSVTMARALSTMVNALGQPEFPNVSINGTGSIMGIPIVSSQYIARFGTTGGEYIIAVDPAEIWFADDGQVTVDASREASLQMDDSPSEVASGGTGASMVSMWQTNSIAIRCERYVYWQKRRTAAVQVLQNVFYGSPRASGT